MVFFAVVLFVQFLGMLLHRLETFKYVLAVATVRGQNSRIGRRGTITQGKLNSQRKTTALSETEQSDTENKMTF